MAHNSENDPARAAAREPVNVDELVRLFCTGLRSCDILEDLQQRSFRQFMQNLLKYSLPSKKQFTEEIIPEVFNRARADLLKTLESVHHVAISIETWQWGNTHEINMLTATIHFIHQSKFVSQTLFTKMIQGSNYTIKDGLIDWQVLDKVVSVTTSRRMNDNVLAEVILKTTDIFTEAHELDYRIQTCLSHINFEEIEMKCRNDNSDSVLKIKEGEPFRWRDQYMVLKHISEHNAGNFTPDERKAYRECFQMLKFVEDFYNKLSSQQFITMSCIFPLFVGLTIKISQCTPSCILGKQLKEKLELECNAKRNINLMNVQIVAISGHTTLGTPKTTFLDPRFKTTILKYHFNSKGVQEELEAELNQFINEYNQQNPVPSCSNSESKETENLFDYLTDKPEYEPDSSSRAKTMMQHYIQIPDIPVNENPLQFWEDFSRTYKYSEFHIMAKKYLCIPANAIPIQTVSGEFPWNTSVRDYNTYDERRKSLEYENINEILFLHSYYSRNPEK